jgi:hypothetical protein
VGATCALTSVTGVIENRKALPMTDNLVNFGMVVLQSAAALFFALR